MSNILIKDGKVVGGLPISVENMTLLWENPSPTASFPAQTVMLSSADWDFLLVVANSSSIILKKGVSTNSISTSFSYNSRMIIDTRILRLDTNNNVVFNSCYRIQQTSAGSAVSTAQNDSLVIPVAIYGIKKDGVANNVSTKASDCHLNNGDSVEDVLVSRPLITQDNIRAQVKNGILYISTDSVAPSSVGSWSLITTLPVGYRPNANAYFIAIAPANNNAICAAFINTGGDVSIKSNNSYNYVFSGALPIKEN